MVLGRSTILRLLLAVTVLSTGACSAPEDVREPPVKGSEVNPYTKAKRDYRSGDYLMAAELLIPLSEGGDPRAQYALGYMYYYGKGVLADRERAVELFRRAARGGNARAAEALRMLGEAVPDVSSRSMEGAPEGSDQGIKFDGEPAPAKKKPSEDEAAVTPAGCVLMAEVPQAEPAAAPATPLPLAGADAATRSEEDEPRVQEPIPISPPARPFSLEWLRTREPDHLTIQLVAAGDYDSVQRFVSEHRVGHRAAIVKRQRDGGSWFVVLYGVYATLIEAREALDALPAALRANGPWILRLGDALTGVR